MAIFAISENPLFHLVNPLENITFDTIIIGGGLAGLVSSQHLSRAGLRVALFEPKQYPFHKVCGEYISNEVLPYLAGLDIDPFEVNAVDIKDFELTSPKGRKVSTPLPLGGFSISRYTFDHYIYQRSKTAGTTFIHRKVKSVEFNGNDFTVKSDDHQVFQAKTVIGSFGKRSGLDNFFNRRFAELQSRFVAVKYHAQYDHPEQIVSLHNFRSGYCGVSKVENGHVNICYMTTLQNIKKAGNLENLEKEVMSGNKHLYKVISQCTPVFSAPLTISNISFDKKTLVQDHVLMAGDAAGMINPLAGNGMTMAIHSAKLAAEQVIDFKAGKISREEMESNYSREWKRIFSKRLYWGRQFQKIFGISFLFEAGILLMAAFPRLFRLLIRQTHGKPF